MSNILVTSLQYMANWTEQSDADVQGLIDEFKLFKNMGDFDSDPAVHSEFNMLTKLAEKVKNLTIVSDSVQMAADAAAVGAIWSFGLGMFAFVAFETEALVAKALASKKANDLNEKLKTADVDISANINPKVRNYIEKFKHNNTVFKAMGSAVGSKLARNILFTFMAGVYHERKGLNVKWFKKYAASAKLILNNKKVLDRIGDALNRMNLQDDKPTEEQIEDLMKTVKDLQASDLELKHQMLVTKCFVFAVMVVDLRVAANTLVRIASKVGLFAEELSAETAARLESVELASRCIGVLFAVADVIFQIYDIVNVVEQTAAWEAKLNGDIRQHYKDYFNGIREASIKFNKAMEPKQKRSFFTAVLRRNR